MAKEIHKHTREEIRAFLDNRLDEVARKKMLHHLNSERGTLGLFLQAALAASRKHEGLPDEELDDLKSIVRGGLLAGKAPLVGAVAGVVIIVLVIAAFVLPSGTPEETSASTSAAGKTGKTGRRTSRKTGTARRTTRPTGRKTGRKTGRVTGRTPDLLEQFLRRIPNRSNRDKVRLLTKTSKESLFEKLRDAVADNKAEDELLARQAFAVLGGKHLDFLGSTLGEDYNVSDKLAVTRVLSLMTDWTTLNEDGLKSLYAILKENGLTGSSPALRAACIGLIAKPSSLRLFKNVLSTEQDPYQVFVDAMQDSDDGVRVEAIDFFSRARKPEAIAEIKRALAEDPSTLVKAIALEKLKTLARKDESLLAPVRELLSSSDAGLKFAASDFLLQRLTQLPSDDEQEILRGDIVESLGTVAAAGTPGEGTVNSLLAKKVTSAKVTASEAIALLAVNLALKNTTGDTTRFLKSLAGSPSSVVRRYVIIEMVLEKHADSVGLLTTELRSLDEKEGVVFAGKAAAILKRTLGMPADTADDVVNRNAEEAADLIDEWWAEAKAKFEEDPEEKPEPEEPDE